MQTSNQKPHFEPYLNPELQYQVENEGGELFQGLKGSFMAVESAKKSVIKKRTQNTGWIYVHKLGEGFSKSNIKWKFIPQGQDNVYKIVVAGGQFMGHQLFCHEDSKMDIRDKVPSCYAFVCPTGYMEKFNKWKFEKYANNVFLIKNTDNNYYLSCHRFYPNTDVRDKNSTYVMGFPQQKSAAYWKIVPF